MVAEMKNLVNGYVYIPKCSLRKLINYHGVVVGSIYFLLQYDIVKFLFQYIFATKNTILSMLVMTLFQLLPNSLREWLSFKFLIFNYIPSVYHFWNEIFSFPFIIVDISEKYYCFTRSDVRSIIIVMSFFITIIALVRVAASLKKEYVYFQYDWIEWIKRKMSVDYRSDKTEDFDISVGDVIRAVSCSLVNKIKLIALLSFVVTLYALC